jgi:hypothetical protein
VSEFRCRTPETCLTYPHRSPHRIGRPASSNPHKPVSNAVSREWLNAYERGLGEQYSLHASDPHMGWDDSGTKALVGSQFVLARDVEFSCAASLTFVSWNGSARGSL